MTPRPRTWSGLVAFLLVVLVGCGGTDIRPPSAPASDGDRAAQAMRAVQTLEQALVAPDRSAAVALGVGGAGAVLGAAVDNIDQWGIGELSLRFVDVSALDADDLARFGPDAWGGIVEVRYRLTRWDGEQTRVETPMVFVPGTGGARITAIGGAGGRTPLWLRGAVSLASAGRAVVLARGPEAGEYLPQARRALTDVARVLPDWRGTLVLEVPGSEEELDQALGADQAAYANIAAVTAPVDGSQTPGAPVHVFLNPRVFEKLGTRASQVVLSHETTHVATEAVLAPMPDWLREGFADYVALVHAGIPVQTAGAQILARVRKSGPPDHLPTTADLQPTATNLGATYEEAWLAARFIAEQYGEAELVAFYRAVDQGSAVATAFTDVLGTTETSFVKAWSADLVELAGAEAS